ncbi:MAG TPA: adenosylmethionine decarboxylase [Nitrospiria bacterium]
MHALGRHLLLELKLCNSKVLNDLKKVQEIMVSAAKEAKATIVEISFHKFSPFGISGVVVIAESHISIHTWPEYGYAAIDIFTCGDVLQPETAADHLIEKFQSKDPSIVELKRGILIRGDVKLPHKPVKEVVEYARTKELQMVP